MDRDIEIDTKIFPENRKNGLMICGINFGYSAQDKKNDEDEGYSSPEKIPSFFSDGAENNTDFRNGVLTWFDLWGVSLSRNEAAPGSMERSILQTNWLPTQSNRAGKQYETKFLVENSGHFLRACTEFQPRLIFLFGKLLIEAFNSSDMRVMVEGIFGERCGAARFVQKSVNASTKRTFVFQKHRDVTVVCMPHVTGGWGLSHECVGAFRDEMKDVIDVWWQERLLDMMARPL